MTKDQKGQTVMSRTLHRKLYLPFIISIIIEQMLLCFEVKDSILLLGNVYHNTIH